MKGIRSLLVPMFKSKGKLFISMILIGAIGISLVVGLLGAYHSLRNQLFDYLKTYHYPDITYELAPIKKTEVDLHAIEAIDGVEDTYLRLKCDCGVTYEEELLSGRIFTYTDTDFLTQRVISETERSSTYYNIAIDSKYSKLNHISLGSILTLNIMGYQFEGYVSSIVTNPDCITVRQNKNLSFQSDTFGYIYVRYEDLASYSLDEYANELLILTKEGYSRLEVSSQIKDVLPEAPLSTTLLEDSNIVLNIEDNLGTIYHLSSFVPYVFFAISLFINILFLYQIVVSYRREIGILLTLGYGKGHIYGLFSLITGILGVLSCLLGMGIGEIILKIAYRKYLPHFVLEYKTPMLPVKETTLTSLLLIGLFLLAGFLTSYLIVKKLTPLEAMTIKTDTASFGIKSDKLPVKMKMEVNRILRSYSHNLIAVFCIAMAFSIVFSAFSFQNCKRVVIQDAKERFHTDATIYMSDGSVTGYMEEFEAIDGVSDVDVTLLSTLEFHTESGKSESIVCCALTDEHSQLSLLGLKHQVTDLPDNGILLDIHTANRLEVGVGDFVFVGDRSVRVAGLSDLDIIRMAYMSYGDLLYLTSNYMYCIFVSTENLDALEEHLLSSTTFLALSLQDRMINAIEATYETADIGVVILTIMGLLLGLVTILNMKEIQFEKEKRTIAVKRTLGFQARDISLELILEDILKGILGIGIGCLFGRILAKYSLKLLETYSFSFPYRDHVLVYIIATFFIVFVMAICQVRISIGIRKLPLSELVKDKE